MCSKTIARKIRLKLEKTKNHESRVIEDYIDLGELLIQAKGEVDNFAEWLKDECSIRAVQASRFIRIATHKEQSRKLIAEGSANTIDELQPLLPKTSEAPIETEADADHMAYVGAKPGSPARNPNDWHTPVEFIEAARKVMGSIDLDPFSSVQANSRVNAAHFFTQADDAFETSWARHDIRTVWMNPPYSKGLAGQAVQRFIEQYDYGAFEQAIVLMNAGTDTAWYHDMINRAAVVTCLTKGRISFEDAGGKASSGNTKGQVFFYIGKRVQKFRQIFRQFGAVQPTELVKW